MALIVDCACGGRLEADDEQAGKEMPCPSCGKMLELPQPYNPLSMTKYLQAAADQNAAAVEEAPPSGPKCEDCVGSGKCRHCHGEGRLRQPFLDRVTGAISGTVSSAISSLNEMLGGGPAQKKVKTRSEKRRVGACPSCEGTGQCFACEGSGRVKG